MSEPIQRLIELCQQREKPAQLVREIIAEFEDLLDAIESGHIPTDRFKVGDYRQLVEDNLREVKDWMDELNRVRSSVTPAERSAILAMESNPSEFADAQTRP